MAAFRSFDATAVTSVTGGLAAGSFRGQARAAAPSGPNTGIDSSRDASTGYAAALPEPRRSGPWTVRQGHRELLQERSPLRQTVLPTGTPRSGSKAAGIAVGGQGPEKTTHRDEAEFCALFHYWS